MVCILRLAIYIENLWRCLSRSMGDMMEKVKSYILILNISTATNIIHSPFMLPQFISSIINVEILLRDSVFKQAIYDPIKKSLTLLPTNISV